MSLPEIGNTPGTVHARKAAQSAVHLPTSDDTAISSSFEGRSSTPETPRSFRSGSLVSTSSPVVGTDATHADTFKPSSPPETSHAMAAMLNLSSSPVKTPLESPTPTRSKVGSQSSQSSRRSEISEKDKDELTPQPATNGPTHNISAHSTPPIPSSPASIDGASLHSDAPSVKSYASFGSFGRASRQNTASSSASSTTEPKRISLATVAGAAASAKQWGWNAIQRHADRKADEHAEAPASPPTPRVMGRGQPLPPPGMPLPGPDKKTKTAPIPVPKRKVVPPPTLPTKSAESKASTMNEARRSHPLPPPTLPLRRSRGDTDESNATDEGDGLFVVSAPQDSQPTTPSVKHTSYMQPWVEDGDDLGDESQPAPIATPEKVAPKLPKRRGMNRVLSSSPDEDGHKLPSW